MDLITVRRENLFENNRAGFRSFSLFLELVFLRSSHFYDRELCLELIARYLASFWILIREVHRRRRERMG